MAELQPPEGPVNGGGGGGGVGGSLTENPSLGSKRQRRPSVRLGDIGDQSDSYLPRRTKQWHNNDTGSKFHRHPQSNTGGKSSKTRPLTNLGNGGGGESHETLEIEEKNGDGGGNLDLLAIGNRRAKRGKRVRSNWGSSSKVGEGGERFSGGEEEGFKDFDPEDDSQEQSPIHSLENLGHVHGSEKEGLILGQRRPVSMGARVSASRERDHDGIELDGPSDTDGRDWKCGTSNGVEKVKTWRLEDGIRMWLEGLGLGQYTPVFEIHEVDEDVLPSLTLEDLKDMGINAVGSRRKLYSAIQKIAKGFFKIDTAAGSKFGGKCHFVHSAMVLDFAPSPKDHQVMRGEMPGLFEPPLPGGAVTAI